RGLVENRAAALWRETLSALDLTYDEARRNRMLMSASDIAGSLDRTLAITARSRHLFVRETAAPLARLYQSLFEPRASRRQIGAFLSRVLFETADDWRL